MRSPQEPSDGSSASEGVEATMADDEDVSDPDVLPQEVAGPRRGRPLKPRAAGQAEADGCSARLAPGRPRGVKGRRRSSISPQEATGEVDGPEERRRKRSRTSYNVFSPGGAHAEHVARMRKEKERQNALAEHISARAFDLYAAMDVREL